MQFEVVQRITAVLKGVGKPSATACPLVALSVLIALFSGAATSQPSSMKVSSAEQSARDNDRLLVLRSELKKSETLVESLARRRAERLAASDLAAADEAEGDRIRALSDIAGIKREIAATTAPTRASAPPSSTSAVTAKPAQPRTEKVAPWWDVYGKPRRADTAGPDVSAQASGPTPARLEPQRRME